MCFDLNSCLYAGSALQCAIFISLSLSPRQYSQFFDFVKSHFEIFYFSNSFFMFFFMYQLIYINYSVGSKI
ncbi:hypothetical protein DSECCO2_589470 [anaerobic digester metagenome]